MPQKPIQKSGPGEQSAPRGQQLTNPGKPAASSKTPSKTQAKREEASKAADAGAAPEQLDAESE